MLLCSPVFRGWAESAQPNTGQIDIGSLQLAKRYEGNINVADYLISEKLDGIRARWTGAQLITRNGNVIHAPPWFTQYWPEVVLDGELWTQRGDFENIASIVLSDNPDGRWQQVKMMVFDMPKESMPFATRMENLAALLRKNTSETLVIVPQFRLHSLLALEQKIDAITAAGGEGLMLHHRNALYKSGRSQQLLKAKRHQDAEAKVVAYIKGQGRFSGMLGSLLLEMPNGVRFKVGSGFTLLERQHPPPIGSWITYKYFGKTKKGVPRFASFLHSRPRKDRPE
ncbi:DNA ligase [Alteromonas sp. 345S023]|uniref:DNA ligase n=2 Tax=Alteromonas profundi TaxID=2696062 RepID=A0A7X5LID2_9ALTE|nr:DNA ligase [Alteromonas profundi]